MYIPANHALSHYNDQKPPRVQQRTRGLARRHYGPTGIALDSTNYCPAVIGPKPWHPGFPPRRDGLPSHDRYNWPRDVTADLSSSSRAVDPNSARRRAAESPESIQGVSFADAAAKLDEALFNACRTTERFLPEFEDDVRRIASYADDEIITLLWKTKLEHDGIHKNMIVSSKDKKARSLGFREALERFEAAAVDIRTCQPPHWTAKDGRDRMSPEQVRSIMRKLDISFESIKELTELVVDRREKMDVLHKELVATHKLLCEMHEFWCTKGKTNEKRFAGMQASFEDDPFDNDERWDQ